LSQFEYITVFLSIVMALAVAELLIGLGRLIRERDHVKIYWVHVGWMILGIIVLTSSWWSIWKVRSHVFASYFEFLSLLLPSLFLVTISLLLSPPIDPGRPSDLREYYFRHIRWIAVLVAVQVAFVALSRVVLGVEGWFAPVNGIRLIVAGVILSLGFSVNQKLHSAALLIVAGLFSISLIFTIFGAS